MATELAGIGLFLVSIAVFFWVIEIYRQSKTDYAVVEDYNNVERAVLEKYATEHLKVNVFEYLVKNNVSKGKTFREAVEEQMIAKMLPKTTKK